MSAFENLSISMAWNDHRPFFLMKCELCSRRLFFQEETYPDELVEKVSLAVACEMAAAHMDAWHKEVTQ